MGNETNYEKDTRSAYQDISKAKIYKRQHQEGITWARFVMWREIKAIEDALNECKLASSETVLDIPCGTGVLAELLCKHKFSVVASDISIEMMELASEEYDSEKFSGFVQGDITLTPFRENTFSCLVILGLMHRLPKDVRKKVLKEVTAITRKYVIVSYSIDSFAQRLKWKLIKMFHPGHKPSPSPATLGEILKEIESNELALTNMKTVVPFLSAEAVFLLEKKS